MKTDDNRDKLRLIKNFFIFNMLQQPSCFININKTAKKNSANIKQENRYLNNLSTEKSLKDNMSTESAIPICDKLTMAKFLVILKLLQQPYSNENMNKTSKSNPINIKNENRVIPNNLGLINNSKNKNSKFMFFIQRVTFKSNSQSINKKSEINTEDNIYKIHENENADYLESSTPILPIIIEEKDIDTDIPIE
ncbi:hypothetical protein LL033_01660 [Clostridium estertheticum]|uniref:hypothetical protein n=1 Tax=Clostridium estertheticum TaxID=238834 RepID=UPI001C0C73A9|nr:hypothetical protein [Clostridium estertheticum]MBU3216042.1 hypothetical protein [Clostridium estertheticum]WAG55970.1 hypothetical protein LL033_01660 [Clostridium estertheticum]